MASDFRRDVREFFQALGNPMATLGDVWDFLNGWRVSRRWLGLILLSLFPAIFAMSMFVLLILGMSQGKEKLLMRYVELAEKEAPLKTDALAQRGTPEELQSTRSGDGKENDNALLYFRRVLQLENDNKRARYYVAAQYATRGSLAQARKMMESLAPSKEEGYLPAHAWMAVDLIQQKQKGLPVSDLKLRHHLSKMAEWPEVSPNLLYVNAQFLASKNEKDAAVAMVQQAARRDSKLLTQAAMFAKALENTSVAEQLASNAILYHQAS